MYSGFGSLEEAMLLGEGHWQGAEGQSQRCTESQEQSFGQEQTQGQGQTEGESIREEGCKSQGQVGSFFQIFRQSDGAGSGD